MGGDGLKKCPICKSCRPAQHFRGLFNQDCVTCQPCRTRIKSYNAENRDDLNAFKRKMRKLKLWKGK